MLILEINMPYSLHEIRSNRKLYNLCLLPEYRLDLLTLTTMVAPTIQVLKAEALVTLSRALDLCRPKHIDNAIHYI